MQRYYDELATYERDGFTVIVDKTWEDLDPKQCFEADDLPELYEKIDNGTYDWFMLRVRVLVEGLELADHYLGGCCYEDAKEVLTDGTAEDCIAAALTEAKKDVYRLKQKFCELSDRVDREAVA